MSDTLVKEIVSASGQDRLTIHRTRAGLYYYIDEFLRVHTGDDDFGNYPTPSPSGPRIIARDSMPMPRMPSAMHGGMSRG